MTPAVFLIQTGITILGYSTYVAASRGSLWVRLSVFGVGAVLGGLLGTLGCLSLYLHFD